VNEKIENGLLTIKAAAALRGLPYWKLQRAVKLGIVPSYRLLNSRRLIRIEELDAVIRRSREGGAP
jgi:hypothetical protein